MSAVNAALAYGKAGIPVVPVKRGTKNPGSLLGNGWPQRATTDLTTIRDWWRRWPDAGIATHPGAAGLLVIDVDKPEQVPQWLWPHLDTALFRPTTTQAGYRRGHYFYALADGQHFGCGRGGLGNHGFDVKCSGGAIVLAPTAHPTDGHAYHGSPGGPVPPLPDVIARKLKATKVKDVVRTVTAHQLDTQAQRFLTAYTDDKEPHALAPILDSFDSTPDNRHPTIWDALCWAMREGKAGRFPAQRAVDELRKLWAEAIGGAYRSGDPDEFDRMLRDAIDVADSGGTAEELWARAHRPPVDEDEFWNSRECLRDLRQFAYSRLVAPWAVLGCVLARAVAAIPPDVALPPTVGGHSSLNLFTALVGPSGGGKGAAARAAAEWLGLDPAPYVATVGSGEGLAKVFAVRKRNGEQIGLRVAALFDVPEVDNLAALKSRSGATLLPQLRSAWSGEQLGFAYADPTKAITVCGHRYRLCLVLGVQPGRAGALLDDADGGTPQRFVWLPTTDPALPDTPPEQPPRRDLRRWPDKHAPRGARRKFDTGPAGFLDRDVTLDELRVLPVPGIATEAVVAHRRAVTRGDSAVDPLDGHKLQCQLKIAAALMYLDNRVDGITEDDWELAGDVMAVSTSTRESVTTALQTKASDDNRRRGRAEGEREIERATVVDTQRVGRVAERIHVFLLTHDGQGSAALRRQIAARDRDVFDDAVSALTTRGTVRIERFTYKGQRGERLRLGTKP